MSDKEYKVKLTIDDAEFTKGLSDSNKMIVDILKNIDANMQAVTKTAKKQKEEQESSSSAIAKGLIAVQVASQLTSKAMDFLKSSIMEAANAGDSVIKLNNVLQFTGTYSKQASDGIISFADALEKQSSFSAEAIQDQISLAIQMGKNVEQAKYMAGAAANLATTLGTDLGTAMDMLQKSMTGVLPKVLKVNPALKAMGSDSLEAGGLVKYFANQNTAASTASSTFAGNLNQLDVAYGDIKEAIGEAVLGGDSWKSTMQEVIAVVKTASAWLGENKEIVKAVAIGMVAAATAIGAVLAVIAIKAFAVAAAITAVVGVVSTLIAYFWKSKNATDGVASSTEKLTQAQDELNKLKRDELAYGNVSAKQIKDAEAKVEVAKKEVDAQKELLKVKKEIVAVPTATSVTGGPAPDLTTKTEATDEEKKKSSVSASAIRTGQAELEALKAFNDQKMALTQQYANADKEALLQKQDEELEMTAKYQQKKNDIELKGILAKNAITLKGDELAKANAQARLDAKIKNEQVESDAELARANLKIEAKRTAHEAELETQKTQDQEDLDNRLAFYATLDEKEMERTTVLDEAQKAKLETLTENLNMEDALKIMSMDNEILREKDHQKKLALERKRDQTQKLGEQKKEVKSDEKTWQEKLNGTQDALSAGASLMASSNAKQFEIGKAAAIANATISIATAALKAWELGPILGPIMSAVVITAGMAQLSAIKNTKRPDSSASKFAAGGIINSGGANIQGDKVNVAVNDREMLLNMQQQRNLFDMASTGNFGAAGSLDVLMQMRDLMQLQMLNPINLDGEKINKNQNEINNRRLA